MVFIICHLFRHVLSAWELHYRYNIGLYLKHWPHKQTRYMMSEISHVMIVLNSCVNFYVYLFKRYLNSNNNYIQVVDTLNMEIK